jgi:hypothetical protein
MTLGSEEINPKVISTLRQKEETAKLEIMKRK